jgi:hypothetical protein
MSAQQSAAKDLVLPTSLALKPFERLNLRVYQKNLQQQQVQPPKTLKYFPIQPMRIIVLSGSHRDLLLSVGDHFFQTFAANNGACKA